MGAHEILRIFMFIYIENGLKSLTSRFAQKSLLLTIKIF